MYKNESLGWLVSTLFTSEFLAHNYSSSTFSMLSALSGGESGAPQYITKEDRRKAVDDFIRNNNDAAHCFVKAKNAVEQGEIKKPETIINEWGEKSSSYDTHDVNTYSFYLWAEKNEYALSEEIITCLKPTIHVAIEEENAEKILKRVYPKISREQFDNKSKEPLWSLANGILYLLGHRNSRDENIYTAANNDPTIKTFISRTLAGKKLLKYAGDAAIAGKLTLIGNQASAETDEELLETFVEPEAFIKWAKTMPVTLTIFSDEDKPKDAPKYQTKDMRLLNDAIEHFWKEYDLEKPDPSLAPFKKEVVKWLMTEAKERNIQDFSENRAKVMDTIMRCPKSRGGGNTL